MSLSGINKKAYGFRYFLCMQLIKALSRILVPSLPNAVIEVNVI